MRSGGTEVLSKAREYVEAVKNKPIPPSLDLDSGAQLRVHPSGGLEVVVPADDEIPDDREVCLLVDEKVLPGFVNFVIETWDLRGLLEKPKAAVFQHQSIDARASIRALAREACDKNTSAPNVYERQYWEGAAHAFKKVFELLHPGEPL